MTDTDPLLRTPRFFGGMIGRLNFSVKFQKIQGKRIISIFRVPRSPCFFSKNDYLIISRPFSLSTGKVTGRRPLGRTQRGFSLQTELEG